MQKMQETGVQSLGLEDPLESRILDWLIISYSSQYSCLENHMDRGAWEATVYRVAESNMLSSYAHTHTHARARTHTLLTIVTMLYLRSPRLSWWLK